MNLYSHFSVTKWIHYFLSILNTCMLFKILIICSFLSLVKETKETFSIFFSGNRAFAFIPCRWVVPSSMSCQLEGSARAAQGYSRERPGRKEDWWILSLWSYEQQGTLPNSSALAAELKKRCLSLQAPLPLRGQGSQFFYVALFFLLIACPLSERRR